MIKIFEDPSATEDNGGTLAVKEECMFGFVERNILNDIKK